jgi:Tol biopolymer transport system component/C-terminal processing protease CtpA/Prc
MLKPTTAAAAMLLTLIAHTQSAEPLWLTTPAISPDGKSIAFSFQGDIYTVPYQGGEARQITLHEAYEHMPVWSPDSKSIAFASYRHGNKDIFIVSAAGGAPKRLTFHSAHDDPYTFSPDGKSIIFGSPRLDHHNSVLFPSGAMPELYNVPISGERPSQIMTVPAEMVSINPEGTMFLFHDQKGYEDPLRKHHTSSIARDIWSYNTQDSTFVQVSTYEGEDRNPVWAAGENRYFFLSERDGTYNIWKAELRNGKEANARQVTTFKNHPVRSLSLSSEGVLCFNWNGELYTQLDGQEPRKVAIQLNTDRRYNENIVKMVNGGATDFTVSPNGKEIAFIVRGEVFVTAVDYSATKRITDTPEQERDLHFNHDGTKLLYSGERKGSWNIYEASLERKDEKYFYNATLIKESPVVETEAETFQGQYSPDGKEVAFLEERTTLRIKNLESGVVRTIMPAESNYSYSDGDQYYTWSPDSKWLLVQYFGHKRWNDQIGLVSATGNDKPINLSESGYGNVIPKFAMGGEMVYWYSDRDGFRSHGSWGSQGDVYALFLTNDAYKKFTLNEADYAFWKEQEEEKKKKEEKEKDESKGDKKGKDGKEEDEKKKVEPLKIDTLGLTDRRVRLTAFSSFLSDFLLDEKAENLYFITNTDEKYKLWKTNFKDEETKILSTLGDDGSGMYFDKEEKHLFVSKDGGIQKIAIEDGKTEPVEISSEMNLNTDAERAYMFEHAWRQFKKKFYLEDLHGVDWDMYKANYERFLPYINNSFDFADMLGEMLGEVNASHTGAFYPYNNPAGDQTAALGVFFDPAYTGKGLRIAEVMDKSPLILANQQVKAGVIIEKIDGKEILPTENYYPLLNRKAGKKTLISYFDPASGKRWDEVVEPIGRGQEFQLAYERWVKTREAETERLSNGKIGYVHVRGMNSSSFRELYSKALGKHNEKDALVVDTRFNGGGWLHDDLVTFLSGEAYMQFEPRGQTNMGGEPDRKWSKPSAVIIGESNYSDAHMFPYAYKFFEIGKLIGMPVPGTGTAVWWESMLDGTIFGIPQVGMRDVRTGQLLENQELEPDIKVMNEPTAVANGRDQQLEKAVEHLLGITKE